MIEIRQAAAADHAAIDALLSLSHAGESHHRIQSEDVFFVADSAMGLIGVGGLDPCGDNVGLLHSLLVRPGFRKQRIARQIYQQVLDHAYDLEIRSLYTVAASSRTYLETLGFSPIVPGSTPESLNQALLRDNFDPSHSELLHRSINPNSENPQAANATADPSALAAAFYDAGYYCAESVLLAMASHLGLDSPWLPRIATGFCSGQSHTWGTCGAHSGGVLALNLALGRNTPDEAVARNYQAVQRFSEQFRSACGGCRCSELLGCDLDTQEGRSVYRENKLHVQCREYVVIATRLARDILGESRDLSAGTAP